jgi:hypothetical protein
MTRRAVIATSLPYRLSPTGALYVKEIMACGHTGNVLGLDWVKDGRTRVAPFRTCHMCIKGQPVSREGRPITEAQPAPGTPTATIYMLVYREREQREDLVVAKGFAGWRRAMRLAARDFDTDGHISKSRLVDIWAVSEESRR